MNVGGIRKRKEVLASAFLGQLKVNERMNNINELIQEISKLTPPIDGDPTEWLEKDWGNPLDDSEGWREFLCGSCRGIYKTEDKEFKILAVQNTKKNDNFDKVLEWFKKSCIREGYKLAFLEVGNPKLKEKLEKLGFVGDEEKMVKDFELSTYPQLSACMLLSTMIHSLHGKEMDKHKDRLSNLSQAQKASKSKALDIISINRRIN